MTNYTIGHQTATAQSITEMTILHLIDQVAELYWQGKTKMTMEGLYECLRTFRDEQTIVKKSDFNRIARMAFPHFK